MTKKRDEDMREILWDKSSVREMYIQNEFVYTTKIVSISEFGSDMNELGESQLRR